MLISANQTYVYSEFFEENKRYFTDKSFSRKGFWKGLTCEELTARLDSWAFKASDQDQWPKNLLGYKKKCKLGCPLGHVKIIMNKITQSDDEEELLVFETIEERRQRSDKTFEYLIKYEGLYDAYNTWLPEDLVYGFRTFDVRENFLASIEEC